MDITYYVLYAVSAFGLLAIVAIAWISHRKNNENDRIRRERNQDLPPVQPPEASQSPPPGSLHVNDAGGDPEHGVDPQVSAEKPSPKIYIYSVSVEVCVYLRGMNKGLPFDVGCDLKYQIREEDQLVPSFYWNDPDRVSNAFLRSKSAHDGITQLVCADPKVVAELNDLNAAMTARCSEEALYTGIDFNIRGSEIIGWTLSWELEHPT